MIKKLPSKDIHIPSEELPSNRKFGFFFSFLFICIAGLIFYKNLSLYLTLILVSLSASFLLISFISPQLLSMPNRLWYKLGIALSKIVNPIVLGFIFFFLITPVALVTRIFGRDELRIKKRLVLTYWIDRSPPELKPDSFKKQF